MPRYKGLEMNNIHKKYFELKKMIGKVAKTANNPFFKTKYSDLNSVIEATDPAIEECGLIYIDTSKDGVLKSSLIDVESGESIDTYTSLILSKNDMQQYGSALTYSRRYNRMTLLGLQAVDDDGSATTGNVFAKPKQIKIINELMLATKTDTAKFLQYFHVASVKDLTEQAAIQAIKTLTLKKEKGVTDANS